MRTRHTLTCVLAGSLLAACGGGSKSAPGPEAPAAPPPVAEAPPPAASPAPPPPPPPSREAVEQKVLARLQDCHHSLFAKDWDKASACFSDDAVAYMADTPEKYTGGKEITSKFFAPLLEAFPDFNPKPLIVVVNGGHVGALALATGTQEGAFMGVPATHKKIAVYGMRVLEFDGDMIKSDVHYTDPGTWMAQLGVLKTPARPAPADVPASPTVALSKDDKVEADNVATVTKLCAAFDSHDPAAIGAFFADDAVAHDLPSPKDTTGRKAMEAELKGLFKAFPDMKSSCKPWGAGDYVVNEVEWTATNNGAMPPFIKKATKKTVTIHDGEIYQLAGGKVVHYWRASNGMALAMQLGLIAPPKPPKPAKAVKAPTPTK